MTISWLAAGHPPRGRGRSPARARDRGGRHRARRLRRTARACCALPENVYVIEHDDATDEWPHGNTGVIVGQYRRFRDRFLLPALARAGRHRPDPPRHRQAGALPHDDALAFRPQQRRRRLPRRLSGRHADRRAQHGALDRAQPGVLEGALDRAGSPRREALAKLEAELAQRRGRRWQALRRSGAREARRRHRSCDSELGELATWSLSPTQLFDGRLSLDFEGTPIEIEDRGPRELAERRRRLAAGGAHPVRRRHPRALAPALRRRFLAGALGAVLRDLEAVPASRHRAGPWAGACRPRATRARCASCSRRRWSASKRSCARAGASPRCRTS